MAQGMPATDARCRISHFGIQVADLERSLHFYCDLLGLVVARRVVLDDELTRVLVGYPTATLHIAHLKLPDTSALLEVIEYDGVAESPIDTSTGHPGTCHVCFHVDDLDSVYRRLKAAGVQSVSDVLTLQAPPFEEGKVVYVLDPDGIRVELLAVGPYNVLGELIEAEVAR